MSNNQTEIEKKFLIKKEFTPSVDFHTIYQAYFLDENKENKRIRLVPEEKKAILCFKKDIGQVNGFIERIEIENEIPYEDGLIKLIKAPKFIVKKRYLIPFDGRVIELDIFQNLNFSLTMAEIEIKKEDINDVIKYPSWFDKDVSLLKKYRNVNLIKFTENYDFHLKSLLNDQVLKKEVLMLKNPKLKK